MIEINLTPWRDSKRRQDKLRSSVVIITSILSSCTLQLLAAVYLNHQSNKQFLELNVLREQYASVQIQQEKVRLAIDDLAEKHSQIDQIKNFKMHHFAFISFCKALEFLVPNGVFLHYFDYQNGRIKLSGVGKSPDHLNDFFERLKEEELVHTVKFLSFETRVKSQSYREFSIAFSLLKREGSGNENIVQ